MKLRPILFILTSGGKLAGNGVPCYGGCGGDNTESSLLCSILQLHKRILIRPVAADAEKDSFCSIPLDGRQPLCCRSRHASAIRRDSDYRKVENPELRNVLRDYFHIRSQKVKVEESITVYKDAAKRFGGE